MFVEATGKRPFEASQVNILPSSSAWARTINSDLRKKKRKISPKTEITLAR